MDYELFDLFSYAEMRGELLAELHFCIPEHVLCLRSESCLLALL